MHQTQSVSQSSPAPTRLRALARGLLLALLVGLWPAQPAAAQEQPVAPPPGSLVLQTNATQVHQMSTKKKIKDVQVSTPGIVDVRGGRTPDTIVIVGIAPGIATINLTDEDDKKEKLDVVVVQFDLRQLEQVLKRVAPTASVRAVPAGNNAVILTGTVDRVEDLEGLLSAAQSVVGGVRVINILRVGGVQQVQLDVVVALVNRVEFRAMAFSFFANSKNAFLASTIGQAAFNPPQVGVTSEFLNVSGILNAVPGVPNGNPTNIIGGVLHDSWGFLYFLQALRNENVVKLVAEPRLVAMSGRQASFLSGGEQAIPVPAGLGQVGVQFEEFGTRLNFVPTVLGNGRIHLEVEPELSFLDAAAGTAIQGTIVPGRNTQRVRTTVELEAGQTFVIGGLIQHSVTGTTQKTPILGDLPFLGALFSSKSYNETETEVLVMVTPHLVDALDCSQYPRCLPGQETRSPDDFELFLEGILEAPRGSRQIFDGHHYIPAWKNGPTASAFPCDGNGCGPNGNGGPGGCGPNGCGNGHVGHAACVGGQCPGYVTKPNGSGIQQASLKVMAPAAKETSKASPAAKEAPKAMTSKQVQQVPAKSTTAQPAKADSAKPTTAPATKATPAPATKPATKPTPAATTQPTKAPEQTKGKP